MRRYSQAQTFDDGARSDMRSAVRLDIEKQYIIIALPKQRNAGSHTRPIRELPSIRSPSPRVDSFGDCTKEATMVIDPDKTADLNPAYKIDFEHNDKNDHKENKLTFTPKQKLVVSSRQTTRALDALSDLGDFVKGIAGLIFDAITAPAVVAAGLASGKGKAAADPVIDSCVQDGTKVAESLANLIDKIVGDRESASQQLDVTVMELDPQCKTGYILNTTASGEYSSGDSAGGESGAISCATKWGSGVEQEKEVSSDSKNVQQQPLVVSNSLTGQSGDPGTADVQALIKIKTYAGSGFRDKDKPSTAKVELKQIVMSFQDACPGH
jgi:hypothetical protein